MLSKLQLILLKNFSIANETIQLWEFINNTIIILFPSFEDEKKITSTEELQLNQLLASLYNNLNNLMHNNLNILVPPVTNYPVSSDIQQQYTGRFPMMRILPQKFY